MILDREASRKEGERIEKGWRLVMCYGRLCNFSRSGVFTFQRAPMPVLFTQLLSKQHMNQNPTQKNGDVDKTSASSSSGAYVPPARRQQILSSNQSGSRQPPSSDRDNGASNGQSDDKFANFRGKGGYDQQRGAPRSGSEGLDRRSQGQGFFDRPSATSAPRRSKWQEEEGGAPPQRDERERGGRRGRPQLGSDGLLSRDTGLEEELFGNHSNTGINFDKYQVRTLLFVPPFYSTCPCLSSSELLVPPLLRFWASFLQFF